MDFGCGPGLDWALLSTSSPSTCWTSFILLWVPVQVKKPVSVLPSQALSTIFISHCKRIFLQSV
jgi:hypothetical protein